MQKQSSTISGWDILDSLLASIPLGIVVYALVAIAASVGNVTQTQSLLLAAAMIAIQFAYYMNQLVNPRYQDNPTSSSNQPSPGQGKAQ